MKRRRKTARRGRTRPERAALLDALLGNILTLPESSKWLFVDVGYGDEPTTTERTHETLVRVRSEGKNESPRRRNGSGSAVSFSAVTPFCGVQSVGVEADARRVARAGERNTPNMRFVCGGFALRGAGIENASLIRCLNVLRGYGIWDVKPALLEMGRALAPSGLLIEGTTDVEGTLAAVHVWRRNQAAHLDYEGLVCATNFTRGFSPWMFRDVLPRDLRRHAQAGEPVFEWLKAWDEEARASRAARRDEARSGIEANRAVFSESVARLAARERQTDARFAARGVAIFRPERPSTRPEVLCPDDPL